MVFSKSDLKTGMFGVTSANEKFVIVNNIVVYEDGGWDQVDALNENLSFTFRRIDRLYTGAVCFDDLNYVGESLRKIKCVYDRSAVVEMTISEIEQKLGIKNLKIIKEN